MTSFQVEVVRWPVLFISRDNTFFHVAKDWGDATRHAFDDVQKWLGSGVARRDRAANEIAELAEIDVFGRDRRKLRIVSGHGGLSVQRGLDAERVPEEILLGRINAVLKLLEAARAADPELAQRKLPLPANGYSDYLDQVAALLQHASVDHEPTTVTGPTRIADAARQARATAPLGQVFQIAGPSLHTPATLQRTPATTQPPGSATELTSNRQVLPDSRGWLHNLMHQAWG